MQARTRKAIGCFGLLIYMAVYSGLAASLGLALAPVFPMWAQLLYYAVAGIVWILPLRSLFRWMSRGA